MRMCFDACDDAYNYETRAEVRVGVPINSPFWPSHVYRSLSPTHPAIYCIQESFAYADHTLDWILVMATNSLARYFLVKTHILESLGVLEVPAMCMMEEAVQFTFPSVIRIMERLQDTGGRSHYFVMFTIAYVLNFIIVQRKGQTVLLQIAYTHSSTIWVT
jgi:hypothetical protein